MKDVTEFLGYNVGDVITLNDYQTQIEFDQPEVDFEIKAKRVYHEPNGVFHLTCYCTHSPNGTSYMIMVKQVDDSYDLFVFFLDSEGEMYEAIDGQEECPYWALLSEDQEDFLDRIEVTVNFGEESKEVIWDRQGTSTFGVKYSDNEGNDGIVTIADYYTEDDNEGNNFCFIDWKGDAKKGFLEIWYGCLIKDHELSILPVDLEDEDLKEDDNF